MSLTQIPRITPPAPPDPGPYQSDLFDAQTWESAYRQMHDFPTLLIQTRDELARARKREAFWMSLATHAVLLLVILNAQKFEKYLPHRAVMLIQNGSEKKPVTFLELPTDAQKPAQPPKTNVMSDKSRVAMSRTPQVNREELKKLLDASRPGRPGPTAPKPAQQQPPSPPPANQNAETQPPPQQQAQPAPPPSQVAKLQSPAVAPKPSFGREPMSATRSIEEAARKAAVDRGQYAAGDNGDLGLGQRRATARLGDAEIVSDTMGVDFGPYLQRVLHDVKQNWYSVIPEAALPPLLKKGKVTLEFAITKNGQIAGLHYVDGSGDVALDRAAYGGITLSTPFQPLPPEFGGQYLGLRFTFLYNPDPNEANVH